MCSSLEVFKNNIENILINYSTKLKKFNENENYFDNLIKENGILKQERDELLHLLKQVKNDIGINFNSNNATVGYNK
jgi:hypothetical protein